MITPSHIIYNWAVGTRFPPISKKAFIIGGFLPDIPTYLFFFIHTFILASSQNKMWDTLYFDSAWTPFITLSHSFLVWPILIAIGYALKKQFILWLAVGSLFHTFLDFLVHNDDAYRHFWPLSEWKFISPVS